MHVIMQGLKSNKGCSYWKIINDKVVCCSLMRATVTTLKADYFSITASINVFYLSYDTAIYSRNN